MLVNRSIVTSRNRNNCMGWLCVVCHCGVVRCGMWYVEQNDFGLALQKLMTVINVNDTRTHQVIFLTDGQADYPTEQLKQFKLHTAGLRVGVHALGIASYDINFLTRFIEAGTIPGTFQGSERGTSFDLRGASNKIIELVGGETGRSRAFIKCSPAMIVADPFKITIPQKADEKDAAAAPGGPAARAVAAADPKTKSAPVASAAAASGSGKSQQKEKEKEFVREGIPTEIVWKDDGLSYVTLWVASGEVDQKDQKTLTSSDKVTVTVQLEDAADIVLDARVVTDSTNADLFAGWLSERLAAISQAILASENPDIKQLKAIVMEVDSEAQKQSRSVFALKDKTARQAGLDRLKGVSELLRSCHEALAKIAVGQLDRDSKARLLNQ